jgi:hypothetical protein
VPLPRDGNETVYPRLILDIGAAQSRVILGSGDGIRFVKAIDATAKTPDVLAREVLKCVRYYAMTFQGASPKRIELVGGFANDPDVRSKLASTLLLPAKPAKLFADIDMSAVPEADRTPSLGEWAVALGLALKGMNVQPTLSVASAELVAGGAA